MPMCLSIINDIRFLRFLTGVIDFSSIRSQFAIIDEISRNVTSRGISEERERRNNRARYRSFLLSENVGTFLPPIRSAFRGKGVEE